jgi:hypothetical protein
MRRSARRLRRDAACRWPKVPNPASLSRRMSKNWERKTNRAQSISSTPAAAMAASDLV